MAIRGRRPTTKTPPILSHEFVIVNHADIVSCIAMVFVVGLMSQVTSPIASMFITLHHNVTGAEWDAIIADTQPGEIPNLPPMFYSYGWKDSCAVFFYFLIAIVLHAILQEYVLDKLNRRLHLSKVKHSKLNESGQLVAFYTASVIWGTEVVLRQAGILGAELSLDAGLSYLWEGYPASHASLAFTAKFFYIAQLAYWLHSFPELYLQRVKREEWSQRIQLAVLYIAFILPAYLLNFTRVATCLLVLHYTSEGLFHAARLVHYSGKEKTAVKVFGVANVVFVIVRLASVVLPILTFWHGLANGADVGHGWDPALGNFNTPFVRFNVLAAMCLLQAWLMWNFLNFHLRKRREEQQMSGSIAAAKDKRASARKRRHEGKRAGGATGSEDELPEVDQNTKKNLRQRPTKAK